MKLFRLLGPEQAARFALAFARRRPSVELHVDGVSQPLTCRPTTSDIFCLWQIFGGNQCDVELPELPRVIVDAGANVGYASVAYARDYPGAKIIAVEPDSGNVDVARKNLTCCPNVTLLRGAIWARDTWLVIENPADQPWAFRMKESDREETNGVPGRTISRLLAEHGVDHVDLLKMDIEGGEAEVFESGPLDWLDACQVVVIEVHGEKAAEIVQSKMSERIWALKRQGEKLVYTRIAPASGAGKPRPSAPATSLHV